VGDQVAFKSLRTALTAGENCDSHGCEIEAQLCDQAGQPVRAIKLRHSLSTRQVQALLAGGFINFMRKAAAGSK
jgi:hypothetical protein